MLYEAYNTPRTLLEVHPERMLGYALTNASDIYGWWWGREYGENRQLFSQYIRQVIYTIRAIWYQCKLF